MVTQGVVGIQEQGAVRAQGGVVDARVWRRQDGGVYRLQLLQVGGGQLLAIQAERRDQGSW